MAADGNADELRRRARRYWRANVTLLSALLGVWALVSLGFGILFRPFLDQIMLGGYPLGFWFAQQGSIYVFIILIFVYVARMRRIDRLFGADDRG